MQRSIRHDPANEEFRKEKSKSESCADDGSGGVGGSTAPSFLPVGTITPRTPGLVHP